MPDRDGYPIDEELDRIATWPADDLPGWFAFIRSCWWHPGWGWREQRMEDSRGAKQTVIRYHLSTGGWSGNEDIINVMNENENDCWLLTWISSERGGHHVFEYPVGGAGNES